MEMAPAQEASDDALHYGLISKLRSANRGIGINEQTRTE